MISNRSKRPVQLSPLPDSLDGDGDGEGGAARSRFGRLLRSAEHEAPPAGRIVVLIFILSLLLNAASVLLELRLYHGVPAPATDSPFSARSVAATRATLNELVRMPRVAGTENNEIVAKNFILDALRQVQAAATPDVSVEVEVQRPCGSFHLEFLNSFSNSYCNITNVVVRLSLKQHGLASGVEGDSRPAVLINAHFDSFVMSRGASDDGVGVAVMLEVLRLMSSRAHPDSLPDRLQNPVIFLFNGAEESNLQGSHGFITQHRWANSVRAMINLEAIGAGGRELLFQCNSPWVAGVYAENAPFPRSSGIAHEFFQLALWRAAATDWRPFIEFGPPAIAGMDFAYVENGYAYHTSFDTPDIVGDGTLMHTGSNILQLAFALSAAPELSLPMEEWAALNNMQLMAGGTRVQSPFDSSFIFFDFLGLIQVVYSGWWMAALHFCGCFLALIVCVMKLPDTPSLRAAAMHALWGQAASMLAAMATALVYALMAPMRWYAGGYGYASLIFIPPILLAEYLMHEKALLSEKFGVHEEAAMQVSGLLFWTIQLAVTSVVGHRGSYLPLVWAVCGSAAVMVRTVLQAGLQLRGAKAGRQVGELLLVETLSSLALLPAVLCWFYQLTDGLELVVPLMGKTGQAVSGELLLALLYGWLIGSYLKMSIMNPFQFTPVNSFIKSNSAQMRKLVVYPLVGFMLCLFCYSSLVRSSYSESRPKRLWVHHLERDLTGRGEGTDMGLWIVGFDAQGLSPISAADSAKRLDGRYRTSSFRGSWLSGDVKSTDLVSWPGTDEHRKGFNCGFLNGECYLYWPYYFPVAEVLRDAFYIPTKGPVFKSGSADESSKIFTMTAKTNELNNGIRIIEIFMSGPSHLTLVLRDNHRGNRILRWGVLQSTEEETKKAFMLRDVGLAAAPSARWLDGTHYMQVGFGTCTKACLFRMKVEVRGSEAVDISAYGHFVLMQSTKELTQLQDELPSWAKGAEWTNFVSKLIATKS